MLNSTRTKFTAYCARVALLSCVSTATVLFTVEPAIAQKIEKRIQESAAFLQAINLMGVTQQKGEKLGLGVSGSIAGRTNTENNDRNPREMHSLNSDGYECRKTEFDIAKKYATLDAWAHFPDFETKLRDAIIRQQALDRIMIGFNGTSAAAETDRDANPLLQDVNIGWLQKIRDRAPSQHLDGIKVGIPKTGSAIEEGQDYFNLDQAALDAQDLLHPTVRGNPDLVVICSSTLLSDKYVSLAGDSNAATEREAFGRLLSNKKLGGLPVVEAPYFPAGAFLITTLQNLSIYWQIGSRRRSIQDNAKRDRIEDYNTVNEDYVVEEYEGAAFVEGILVPNADHSAWA